jgi:chromosome segregation ATPase
MSESFGQENTTHGYDNQHQARQGLEASAAEFKRSVEEAASRLSNAAEQFISMTDGLLSSINDAKQAAEQAQAAQRHAEELQQRMDRDYGSVSSLVRDLQERISALAVLGRPLPGAMQAGETQSQAGESQGEGHVPQMSTEGEGEPAPEASNLEAANHTGEHHGWQ